MQPSIIQRSLAKRSILRASTTRHWIQTRKPIIAQSRLRCISTEAASENKSDGSNPGKQIPEAEPHNNHFRKSREDSSSHDESSNLKAKMLEAAVTALASIIVLGTGFGLGGYLYHRFYKWMVLHKMEIAFKPGDPVLDLAATSKQVPKKYTAQDDEHWIHRAEQEKIDKIVNGGDRGHYHLLIGEKGVGKSSMLLEAMQKVDGEGVSMFEAHADPEIFRVRLGKALNFEFNEDYIGSYFSERGPRDSTALLDIERAMNKLEKVALKRRSSGRGPLIMIINAVHLLRDDENGRDLLELLQQRAEQWAASNLVTMVFNSDDYWVYERLKLLATRMEVTTIPDLPRGLAISALQRYRQKYYAETPSSEILNEVYNRVGGRLTFLNRVAKSSNMLETCDNIIDTERRWFLNQCWILGMEMDDDVMDQQKYASAAMVLAQALVAAEKDTPTYIDDGSHNIPEIPLHKARQIMTRADFIQQYDHVNLFTITSKAMVRADSVPMQQAFRSICAEEGFEEHLEATLQRINDIESLGRTREIVAKDLVLGGKYKIVMSDGEKRGSKVTEVTLEEKEEEDGGDK
ncbi:4ec08f58-92a2-4737-a96c-2de7c5278db4 [Sclerotinia trifoliorum]|uniref:4ec08f58-92a2-4737-a96c-2de7c5278db4 n=1 Tax=Sclerotinia trifoliorum TaxID=28548 RepID=A0A8H2VRF0_9HELO|nr:4ec08f58-92a2-4737-a96c-2de7c5278db4 [Sclerotinia trifoliorum]